MTDVRVLGTAGHVDHGKTALVEALTGHVTDRLAEERRRGISIELGFAPFPISDRQVSLIDVPGHERFVRHMIAGAGGIDGYLLCVAADDGVMPQTREHLDVLSLLGVDAGVVAVTMADRADPSRAIEEIRPLVAVGTEIVAVSSITGQGIPDLREVVGRLVDRMPRRTQAGPSRLNVDRSFVVSGAGTVVTGTLWGAPMAVEDRVIVHPAGRPGRIRGMHVHDRPVATADGGRVALNLGGVDRDAAARGTVVVRSDDRWHPTEYLDVELALLPSANRSLTTRRRLQAFLGTVETPATCVLLEGDEIAPGGSGLVQLRLEGPVLALAGDRLVLRSADPRTIAGAVVIDPEPLRHGRGSHAAERLRVLSSGDARAIAELALREAGAHGLPLDDPRMASAAAGIGVRLGDRWFAAEIVDAARGLVAETLAAGETDADVITAHTGLPGAATRELVDRAGGAPPRLPSAEADRALTVIRAAGRRSPSEAVIADETGLGPGEVTAALRELIEAGHIVRAGDLWFDVEVARDAAEVAHRALSERPLAIGDLRDLWGVGRRHAVALAAHLEAIGMTIRDGDRRRLRPSYRPSA